MPLFVLWTVGIAASFWKKRAIKPLQGLVLAILSALLVSGKFLIGYFQNYDAYHDLSQYGLDGLIYLRWDTVFWRFVGSLGQFGYDNLALIFYLILLFICLKRKIILKDKAVIFEYVTIMSFILFIGIWFAVTFLSEIKLLNVRHFQILAPMLAVCMAIYLKRLRLGKYIVVSIKTILMLSLLIMIIPRFGASPALNVFRSYYRIPNIDGYGNGVIWSDRSYARREELDYFQKEISKGDILILNRPVWSHLVSLCDRLRLNGVGRNAPFESATPVAAYLIFYCVSSESPDEYMSTRAGYSHLPESESIFRIEEMINKDIFEKKGSGEKLAITDTYQVFSQADILEEYISQFHFKKSRIFEYHTGSVKMYKVIFKSNESIPELINLPELNEYRCLLGKI